MSPKGRDCSTRKRAHTRPLLPRMAEVTICQVDPISAAPSMTSHPWLELLLARTCKSDLEWRVGVGMMVPSIAQPAGAILSSWLKDSGHGGLKKPLFPVTLLSAPPGSPRCLRSPSHTLLSAATARCVFCSPGAGSTHPPAPIPPPGLLRVLQAHNLLSRLHSAP